MIDDEYLYDENGNVAAIDDDTSANADRAMTYDHLDRLTAVNTTGLYGGAAAFEYDPLDNLRRMQGGARTIRHQYLVHNRLTGVTNDAGVLQFEHQYDNRGNQTHRTYEPVAGVRKQDVFAFDYANRLTSSTIGRDFPALTGGVASSYAYDGLGRRVRELRGQYTYTAYNQAGQLLYEDDLKTGHVGRTNYVHLAGSLVAERFVPATGPAVTTYQHTDALGTPVAETDAARVVVRRNRQTAYGEPADGTWERGPGSTGHVVDPTTQLVYMQQRYYDPEVGRFLSVDPVATNPSSGAMFNRFSYANNNPLRFVDPDGRAACPNGSGGTCIDSPRTETGTTVQPAPTQGQRAVDGQVRTASRTNSLSDGTRLNFNGQEQGFKASADGTSSNPMQPICQRCADGSTREGGVFNDRALGANESGGHTHHNNLSGLPGPEDGGLARKTDRTAYVISERGAFAVEKTDVGYRIRIIDGARPTSGERSRMRATIDAWNEHQGGSGVSCTTTSGRC